jgi:membrane fusion protein, multidrug efflux system
MSFQATRMDANESSSTSSGSAPTTRHKRWWLLLGLVLVASLGAAWHLTKDNSSSASASAAKGARGPDSAKIPVAAQPATIVPSFDITLGALGTVTARNTVTLHVRVDGQLVKVAFRDGQMVRAGDLMAQIDPRPFQVVLDNAQATLERDKAQLANALIDLERYRGLIADDSIPKQTYDSQVALVQQDKALVLADQAQVDSAKLQLSFTQVTAPVSGRTGLRQVDPGNMVHATDANGIVVITEVQPIYVLFPIPQDRLPLVRHRLGGGARMPVDAYDSDGHTSLGSGTLLTIDNQIDPTTGTVKLKAEFPNRDAVLFPNQFINVRLHLDQIDHALTIPSAAVQRGAPGLYAYVVKADNTVQIRPLKLGPTEGDRVQVLDGLAANERVVVDGVDKLRDGAAVDVIEPAARGTGADQPRPSGQPGGAGPRKGAPGSAAGAS